ncbi:hypothetical protein ADUPG1_006609, partial [Aduncisulcus paluster]
MFGDLSNLFLTSVKKSELEAKTTNPSQSIQSQNDKCPHCGSNDIMDDGMNLVCKNCGVQLGASQSVFVSENVVALSQDKGTIISSQKKGEQTQLLSDLATQKQTLSGIPAQKHSFKEFGRIWEKFALLKTPYLIERSFITSYTDDLAVFIDFVRKSGEEILKMMEIGDKEENLISTYQNILPPNYKHSVLLFFPILRTLISRYISFHHQWFSFLSHVSTLSEMKDNEDAFRNISPFIACKHPDPRTTPLLWEYIVYLRYGRALKRLRIGRKYHSIPFVDPHSDVPFKESFLGVLSDIFLATMKDSRHLSEFSGKPSLSLIIRRDNVLVCAFILLSLVLSGCVGIGIADICDCVNKICTLHYDWKSSPPKYSNTTFGQKEEEEKEEEEEANSIDHKDDMGKTAVEEDVDGCEEERDHRIHGNMIGISPLVSEAILSCSVFLFNVLCTSEEDIISELLRMNSMDGSIPKNAGTTGNDPTTKGKEEEIGVCEKNSDEEEKDEDEEEEEEEEEEEANSIDHKDDMGKTAVEEDVDGCEEERDHRIHGNMIGISPLVSEAILSCSVFLFN